MQNRKSVILFAIFFIVYEFNTYIANDMIMPGMIHVVNEFHSSLDNIAKSLSLFIIGGSSLQIILGPMCDKYGKRNILLFGNILFVITTILITLVSSIDEFLFARFLQGFGLCFIFIGYAMIHELFDDKTAVKLCSLIANISVFAPLIGPVIGSAIIINHNWRYVFIVTAVLAVISFFGLFKNMPNNKPTQNTTSIKEIISTYKTIFTTKTLIIGGLIISISALPMIGWIGLAPVLVMKTMGKGFAEYVIYQTIVFGGFILSSVGIQFLAGRFSFYTLITRGVILTGVGLLVSLVGHAYVELFIGGLFIASLGVGIFNGSIFRIAITSTGVSNSMSAASLNIIQSLSMALGLELINYLSSLWNFSILSFCALNMIAGIITIILCFKFAKQIRSREWQ